MHVIFETPRLLVRRFTRADEENFFLVNGDADVMRYIRAPKTRSECNVFLLQNMVAYEQTPLIGRWAMLEKASGAFVGSFAIIPVENSVEIQLGYALLKEHWGKGYATESSMGGMQYAFTIMKLPRIVAITEAGNMASQKVLLKCGFDQQSNYFQGERELCYFSCQNPLIAETERLLVFPLTVEQLAIYLKAENKLETLLDLKPTGRIVAPQVVESVTKQLLPLMQAATGIDYVFHTFWLVVDKQTRTIVAELGFKGAPVNGSVEIGYGTMPGNEGKGIMTEAVGGILQWAASRPEITQVLAEIAESNFASLKVVQKNGFEQFDKKKGMLWWRTNVVI